MFTVNCVSVLPDCNFEIDTCGWNTVAELNVTKYFKFFQTKGSLHPLGFLAPHEDHNNNTEGSDPLKI